MKNKLINLFVITALFLPLATALEQTCQINVNASAMLNVTHLNETLNVTIDNFSYNYNNSINFSTVNTISLMRNASCTINMTEGNVSALWPILYNVSKSAEIIAKDSADRSSYFLLYSSCIANLSVCDAKLNISESKQDFEQQYKTCVNEKISVEADRNTASGNLASCNTQKTTLENAQKNNNNYLAAAFALGVAIGAGVVWQWKVKPKLGTDSIHREAQHYE